MSKAYDPYLQAAEGFLHSIRDDIDKLDVNVAQMLTITQTFALVSIARSLTGKHDRVLSEDPPFTVFPQAD